MINKQGHFDPLQIDLVQDTPMVQGWQIDNAKQPKLTASDGTLANAVIRIGQIETALIRIGLLKK
jgi:hypothetical protein